LSHTLSDMSDDPRFTRSRDAILRAVAEILKAEGPGAVTRHWPKPVDLLFEAVRQVDLPFLEPAEGSLRERLRVDLRRMGDDLATPGMASMIATIIDRAQREGDYRARNERVVTRAVTNMRAALDYALEGGELAAAPDPEVLVAQLLGAILFRSLIAQQPTTDDFIDQLVDTALAPWVAPSADAGHRPPARRRRRRP
jgi:Tetracyclin repressor-like, C-terminal domain